MTSRSFSPAGEAACGACAGCSACRMAGVWEKTLSEIQKILDIDIKSCN